MSKAHTIIIKLTKAKEQPVLSFEGNFGDHTLVQDIPIKLLSMEDMESFNEPKVSKPDIKFILPDMKHVSKLMS